MAKATVPGYTGKYLRVDLTDETITEETFDAATLRKWVGGSGIGAKVLYEEVPPGVDWYAPENRVIIASGPLGGTSIAGGGTYSLVTKGPLTNGAVTSQANGFFGAFMRLSGFDGIIIQGAAKSWKWLHIHDGTIEIKDASPFMGLDTWQMQDAVTAALGKSEAMVSAIGVGPAGENLVKFACVAGDKGHVAGHNGTGAVLGAKKVKMLVAERGRTRVPLADSAKVAAVGKDIMETIRTDPTNRGYEWGTSMGFAGAERGGWLPIKNYQTSVFPPAPDFLGEAYRAKWDIKRAPCYACPTSHLHTITITTEGPYKGFVGEEPEYEQWAAWGSVIYNPDTAGAVVLSNEVDRLGVENNEAGWVVGFAMECFQRGILTKEDFGGMEPEWGNVEAARAILRMVAYRRGIGDTLAEGVLRASARLGEEARQIGVYTLKGNSPRGHDHRGRWVELLDTSVSNTGTIETSPPQAGDPGQVTAKDPFDPDQVTQQVATTKGRMIFEDCLGTCRFCTRVTLDKVIDAVNASTGWDMTYDEAMDVGRRVVNLLRVFNLRHGVSPELDKPSMRYGSTPVDGAAAGKAIGPHFAHMVSYYYELMGWDPQTGKPTPETLAKYGLEDAAKDLYPQLAAAPTPQA
jgi:aldehyde:ferredoxin oxidoreductase